MLLSAPSPARLLQASHFAGQALDGCIHVSFPRVDSQVQLGRPPIASPAEERLPIAEAVPSPTCEERATDGRGKGGRRGGGAAASPPPGCNSPPEPAAAASAAAAACVRGPRGGGGGAPARGGHFKKGPPLARRTSEASEGQSLPRAGAAGVVGPPLGRSRCKGRCSGRPPQRRDAEGAARAEEHARVECDGWLDAGGGETGSLLREFPRRVVPQRRAARGARGADLRIREQRGVSEVKASLSLPRPALANYFRASELGSAASHAPAFA